MIRWNFGVCCGVDGCMCSLPLPGLSSRCHVIEQVEIERFSLQELHLVYQFPTRLEQIDTARQGQRLTGYPGLQTPHLTEPINQQCDQYSNRGHTRHRSCHNLGI